MLAPSSRDSAIECFFTPRSVAIVGASADPRKWGWMAAEQALRNASEREVLLVNARGGDILGQSCHRNVASLPDGLDLAVITLPPTSFESTINELVAKGTRAILAITAGFGESGEEGRQTEQRIVQRVRAAGAAMVGPNCMGVFDGHAPFRCMPWTEIEPGPVGFISQSGGLIMDLSLRLADCGLGLSRAVSIGNQADVGLSEFVRNLGQHAATSVLALYGESFVGGREVFREIARVVASGKPVVVMSPDSTMAAHRAARSHTASLATQRKLIQAAARDAGAVYVNNLREMTEVLQALSSNQQGHGRRCFVVTDTGGPGVLLAGEVERAGLLMPLPSAALKAQIEAVLTPRAVVGNPIDLVDNLNVEPAVAVLQALVNSDEADAVLMNLHAFVHDTPEIEARMGQQLAAVARASGKPVVVSCRSLNIPGARALVQGGIPVFRDGDAAARALAGICKPMTAVAATATTPRGVPQVPNAATAAPMLQGDYLAAQKLFSAAGIHVVSAQPVDTLHAALHAAQSLGYPVVLKATSLNHKTDAGAVALGLSDAEQLQRAWLDMTHRLPAAQWAVEPMIAMPGATELLLGLHRDPVLGPVLVIGLGGVEAEMWDDTVYQLAPVQAQDVEAALRRLKAAPRLFGHRGRPGLGEQAVAQVTKVAQALCTLALQHPELDALEVNPLLVSHDRVVALDARITLAQAQVLS
jgi:acetate---CoA ligase (ADP-forming)